MFGWAQCADFRSLCAIAAVLWERQAELGWWRQLQAAPVCVLSCRAQKQPVAMTLLLKLPALAKSTVLIGPDRLLPLSPKYSSTLSWVIVGQSGG